MKKFLIVLFVSVFCINIFATTPKGWSTDYVKALKQAQKENKFVYVLFTGSDWCSWCKKLRNDVLEKPAFKKLAKEKMILVYCDFPRSSKVSDAQKKRQFSWMQQLDANGGVPMAVIVNSDGKVVERISGYMPLNNYIRKLESIVK